MKVLSDIEILSVAGGDDGFSGAGLAGALAAGAVTGGLTGAAVGGVGALPGAIGGAALAGAGYTANHLVQGFANGTYNFNGMIGDSWRWN
ncbi:hypothetical protein [Serratia sp. (in: enterobacteria)]|uniref:hypothetical protein n=1 Tax=Serratia sp. (in: enterobacteria) TaxID=616 RepID=UPI003F398118